MDAFTGQRGDDGLGRLGPTSATWRCTRRALPAVGNGGGLFAYSIPETYPYDDDTHRQLLADQPRSEYARPLWEKRLEDDGIETWEEDFANPGTPIRSDAGTKAGVGIEFNAITFSGQSQGLAPDVRGFAIGNRGDTFVSSVTGQTFSVRVRNSQPG